MPIVKTPCICSTLRQATRVLTSMYDERLRVVGIRGTQFTILQALSLSPKARIADLEGALAMDQTTLTRNLALLARRGFVAVIDRPSGREKCWGLTKDGTKKLAEAIPVWEQAQADVRTKLGSQRARALHTDVFNLAEAFT